MFHTATSVVKDIYVKISFQCSIFLHFCRKDRGSICFLINVTLLMWIFPLMYQRIYLVGKKSDWSSLILYILSTFTSTRSQRKMVTLQLLMRTGRHSDRSVRQGGRGKM